MVRMANGLYCEETLASTPKLRHESTDSNSENTPPELLSVLGKHCDLFCNEVLDENKINQTSQKQIEIEVERRGSKLCTS